MVERALFLDLSDPSCLSFLQWFYDKKTYSTVLAPRHISCDHGRFPVSIRQCMRRVTERVPSTRGHHRLHPLVLYSTLRCNVTNTLDNDSFGPWNAQ